MPIFMRFSLRRVHRGGLVRCGPRLGCVLAAAGFVPCCRARGLPVGSVACPVGSVVGPADAPQARNPELVNRLAAWAAEDGRTAGTVWSCEHCNHTRVAAVGKSW